MNQSSYKEESKSPPQVLGMPDTYTFSNDKFWFNLLRSMLVPFQSGTSREDIIYHGHGISPSYTSVNLYLGIAS